MPSVYVFDVFCLSCVQWLSCVQELVDECQDRVPTPNLSEMVSTVFAPGAAEDKVLPWAHEKMRKQNNGGEIFIGAVERRSRYLRSNEAVAEDEAV